ncbi:MAG TPA: NUDIX hydrolase [Streptosporangiaceae bacterium]|nr:NUDIX hydrolase [Streptosporangiaceae bacterium]
MADTGNKDLIRAAGAVVWRPGQAGPDIALVHRPRYDDWSFPKGKCERDEHVLVTAVREVMEETGLRVALGRRLTPSVYQSGGGVKRASYWAARCVGSDGFVPSHEVDEVQWMPAAQARDRLSYERDVAVLDEFSSGPVRTVPLVLLRHAAAGRKSDWARNRAAAGDRVGAADLARPLDACGLAEANILAGLLASYGKCQVISSAAERCVATVQPYAAAMGVPVQVEPGLTVTGEPVSDADLLTAGARTGQRSASSRPASLAEQGARLTASLATSAEPTLICAHRENLPGLIEAAFGALGARPPQAEPLGKAEFWVLQSADGALVSEERHDPVK